MITRKSSLIAGWAIAGCAGIFASMPANAETHTFTWPIELTVLEGCVISATPMSFGLITGQVNRPTTTAEISLLCNPNINYEISIDNGLNANGNTRRMRNPDNGQHLRYRIYRNAGLTQRWETNANRRVSGNSGATGFATHTAYGEIRNANAGARTGAYYDTVTVTVEF